MISQPFLGTNSQGGLGPNPGGVWESVPSNLFWDYQLKLGVSRWDLVPGGSGNWSQGLAGIWSQGGPGIGFGELLGFGVLMVLGIEFRNWASELIGWG